MTAIGPVENHRDREGGAIVYPVYSRRSKGLSVGINLFPDRKLCSFDCPYCEVFPFERNITFKLTLMEGALRSALAEAAARNLPVRDICFSGNGEPTQSPHFPSALEAARKIRDELAPAAQLVLITNGAGLLDSAIFELLRNSPPGDSGPGDFAPGLTIWLKLDAAGETWYRAVNRSGVPFGELLARIRAFAASGVPFILQTMICKINGTLPPPEECAAWVRLVTGLAAASGTAGRGLEGVHLYGKARPAPEDPLAQAAPPEALEERAAALKQALETAGIHIPVEVFL
jgi:histidinol dehydrogenase